MVKDHSDSERGNPLPSHRLLFPISSKGSFYAPSHMQASTHHGLCYTSRATLAGTIFYWLDECNSKSVNKIFSHRKNTTKITKCRPKKQQKNHPTKHTTKPQTNKNNVLFNDTFNTFYLRLYGVGHRVKKHSARGNSRPPLHKQHFPITLSHMIVHTTTFGLPVVEHWLKR